MLDENGNPTGLSGWTGASGSFNLFNPKETVKDSTELTPAQSLALSKDLRSELPSIKDPKQKAETQAAIDALTSNVQSRIPGKANLVPVVTPGGLIIKPKTNWVPESIATPASRAPEQTGSFESRIIKTASSESIPIEKRFVEVARLLHEKNPGWDEKLLKAEARRIVNTIPAR